MLSRGKYSAKLDVTSNGLLILTNGAMGPENINAY